MALVCGDCGGDLGLYSSGSGKSRAECVDCGEDYQIGNW